MKNGSIKIMSIIALILQTLAVVAGLGTVVWQKILVRAFVNMPTDWVCESFSVKEIS